MSLPQPTPLQIQQARLNAELTHRKAAEIAGLSDAQAWSKYENPDSGKTIPVWRWEWFLVQTGQHPTMHLAEGPGPLAHKLNIAG
ncbi:helix-turn-helix domain-containing protein [Azohydromonas australica]|uniref:helix-turn-helix domain-containing protein n=1 Tax=Azohydromonas australica TaxID=364039 RepID=UPI0004250995|nr:helix-turn-helix transcriptional regulator [Azohydromonas australica]